MRKVIMKKILSLLTASFFVASCASFPEKREADQESCRKAYARHIQVYSLIDYKNQGSIVSSLEREVLLTIQRCPDDKPRLLALLANIEIVRGENDNALVHAKSAEGLDANIWETNAALGDTLTLRGNYIEGLIYLEKASRLAPKNIFLKYNLCTNYEMARHYREAIAACTEVIETAQPKVLGPALYVRARAYEAIGDIDKADRDFKRSKAEGFDGGKYYSKEHLKGGEIK
jgi:tetratricopeptide (TPR) repeat protein